MFYVNSRIDRSEHFWKKKDGDWKLVPMETKHHAKQSSRQEPYLGRVLLKEQRIATKYRVEKS